MWRELCQNIAIANKTKDTRILKKSIRTLLEHIEADKYPYYKSEWRLLCEDLYDNVKHKGPILKTIQIITDKFY
jgi:hypothetical protein